MTVKATAKRSPPTPGQIIAEQKIQARKLAEVQAAARKPAAVVPATVATSTAVAAPDTRTPVQRYIDEVAPASIVGRLIKFSREGKFIFGDTDEEVAETVDFIALCDQTMVGWIKFYNDGETAPSRLMGLLYNSGFVMPACSTLGDMDQAEWGAGLSGAPEDPWKHQMLLVLQQAGTSELFTFATTSISGRRAAGNLLRHFDRMQRLNPDELPIVRLKPGGYIPRDPRRGDWQPVPVFAVVGRAPRDSAAKPDTSAAADLQDEIPHL